MANVVIFGATEAAAISHFCLTHDSPHEVVAFTVDRDFIKEETLGGLPVVPFEDIVSLYPSAWRSKMESQFPITWTIN